ncbi:hypothetical protein niasHS_013324 [Heterodera schachtii]|uniref:Peroxin-14 n=1 Tax=Heterodera schachtii TaxID=97005 RepID=A0ABD2IIF0_HETSC
MPSTSLSSLPPASAPSPSARAVVDLARSALLFGTAGYMVYRFVRSWLLPQLLNVPDPAEERMQRLEQQVERLSDSTRCIAESVTQTLVAVTEQNEQLSRTMMMVQGGTKGTVCTADIDRVHSEIGIVKSLLLNQSQFPPVPESAFPRHRRTAQNGINGTNKGKMPKDENGEAKSSNEGEGEQLAQRQQQQNNGERLNANKNGSPV